MVSEALQNAIDSLEISDVYLREMNSNLKSDFEPKYKNDAENLVVEFKHFVKKSNVVELNGDGKLLQVFVELGIRWLDEEESKEPDEKAKIEAIFVAEYSITTDITPDSIKEFSLQNASYHVWPYWRELVASQSERMRLPRFTMPTVQFAANSSSNSDTPEN